MADLLPADLRRVAELVRAAGPPLPAPPPELRARTLAAIDAEAGSERPPVRGRERWRWRALRVAVPAALATGVAAALIVSSGGGVDGELELRAALTGPGGSATAEVRETGIGRTVTFRSTDLRILPKGEFYELWFAAPDDAPGDPDRISAGTFHPDSDGRSNVTLTAAVDPARYPILVVTAEPGDGDPRPSRDEVLRSRR